MKSIHFDNMRNWIWIIILVLSIVFILVGTFEVFEFQYPKINKRISAMGFSLQIVYFSKMFWYKNYVQWNKKGAVIKINSFMGKSLSFDDIKMTELVDKKLSITKTNDLKLTFDLKEIADTDTHKLHEIIIKNSVISSI